MKLTNISFEVSPEEAQSLHDFLTANGVLCPGPRYSERMGMSHIVAVNRGTEIDVERARQLVQEWRNSRNAEA
jgi:hypothetical protein